MSTRLPRLALRNVARNRRRSAITLGAIFLGVTAVVMLKGIIGGFNGLMVENAVEGNTGALQIHKKGYLANIDGTPLSLNMPYSEAMLAKIRGVKGVRGVSGRIMFSGLVTNGQSQTMFVGRGLDAINEAQACPRTGADVTWGRPLRRDDSAHALVGAELAQSFNIPSANQKAVLTVSSSSAEGRANSLDVDVVGTFTSPLPFENKRAITVPLKLAQDLVGLEGKVTEYAVAVDNLKDLHQVQAELQAALGDEYEVHDWLTVRPFFKDVIARQTFVLGLISIILFAIVITGVLNTMLMAVFERVREIGTMMAVGIRRRQVLYLFLWEAAVLGVAGGLAGATVGRTITFLIARKGIPIPLGGAPMMLRPVFEPRYVAGVVAAAVLGAVISAAYPAWKASRLNPVDALRAN